MSGINYSFDTNALIYFFKGNPNLRPFIATPICLSVIAVMEFLSFPNIQEEDKVLLSTFLKEVEVIDLTMSNTSLLQTITQLRSTYKSKLPDAIIAAAALRQQAILINNDKHITNISSLQTITY